MEKIKGPSQAECFRIKDPSGAEVVIAQHGGHLISWKTACGTERLYLSETAEYQPGKAIRGGVPVIFPQFNENGPFGRHGFARKSLWQPNPEARIMELRSSPATLEIWPFEFELSIGVLLSATTLEIATKLKNTGDKSFEFQGALHSYFRVEDVEKVNVSGLEDTQFSNEVTGQIEASESTGIVFGSEVDRSYRGAGKNRVSINSAGSDETIEISSTNFPDFVVWNPGPDHGIGDLPADGWKQFVCVESAQVDNGEELAPGAEWRGSQKIEIIHS